MFLRSFSNPFLLLTVTAFFWGGNAVAGKLAVGHISPFLLTTLRWILAAAILAPFALQQFRNDFETIRKNTLFLFLLGATGFAIFNNLMYLALNYTSAINVAIEQASMPLFVFVLNFFIFQIRVTWLRLAGYMFTLCGVIVIACRGNLTDFSIQDLNVGDLLMIIGMMVYGLYSVLLKNKPDIHLLSFMFTAVLAAVITSIPFSIYEAAAGRLIVPDLKGWGVVLYTGIFPSILSQLFWVRGLEIVGSNFGGLFVNLVPVFGSLLAIIILGEQFEVYHAIALALVIGGIWMAQKAA